MFHLQFHYFERDRERQRQRQRQRQRETETERIFQKQQTTSVVLLVLQAVFLKIKTAVKTTNQDLTTLVKKTYLDYI